jgi:hypothetical protein
MWWAGCCYVYGQCSRYLAKIGGRIPRDALSWFLAPKHQNRLSLHFLTDCALSWQSQIILHWVDGDNFASLTRNRDGRWRAVELFIPARGPSIARDSDAGDELFFPFFRITQYIRDTHNIHTHGKSSRLTKSPRAPHYRWERHLPLKAQTPLNPEKFAPTGSRTQDLRCYWEIHTYHSNIWVHWNFEWPTSIIRQENESSYYSELHVIFSSSYGAHCKDA